MNKVRGQQTNLLLNIFLFVALFQLGFWLNIGGLFVMMIPLFNIVCSRNVSKSKKILSLLFCNLVQTFTVAIWFYDIYDSFSFATLSLFGIAVFLSIPYLVLVLFSNRSKTILALLFVLSLLTSEFVILHTEIISPIHLLGNYLYKNIAIVQFYQYTGVLGGSLWILLINLMIYLSIYIKKSYLIYTAIILILPISLSIYKYNEKESCEETISVKALHLNSADVREGGRKLTEKILTLLEDKKLSNEDPNIILFPENILTEQINIHNLDDNIEFFLLRKYLSRHPESKIILGAEVSQLFEKNDSVVREKYNTAILIDKEGYTINSKELFVPFDENIPLLFLPILGQDQNYSKLNEVHHFKGSDLSVGVIICYEALFGYFIGKYMNDTDVLAMITNERGLQHSDLALNQYLGMARLRAIEQDKYLVKSTNSGYTSIINSKGDVLKKTESTDKTHFISYDVPKIKSITFYGRYGDYIGYIASFMLLTLVIFIILDALKIIPYGNDI